MQSFEQEMDTLTVPRHVTSLLEKRPANVFTVDTSKIPSMPSINLKVKEKIKETTKKVVQGVNAEQAKQTVTRTATPTLEKIQEMIHTVDETLGQEIEKTAEKVEVYSRTAALLVDTGANLTTDLIGYSSSTIKNTVPTIHHVKVPEPVKTSIKYTAGVTNQGVTKINQEKEFLADTLAKTVSSTVTETTKVSLFSPFVHVYEVIQEKKKETELRYRGLEKEDKDEEEWREVQEKGEEEEEVSDDERYDEGHAIWRSEKHRSHVESEKPERPKHTATWTATKKLVLTGTKAFDDILSSIEGGIGNIKGKAEEEVIDIVKEKLGEDASEVLKDTLSLGHDILSLKGNLSPRGVSKGFAKQISKQIVREIHSTRRQRAHCGIRGEIE